MPKIIPIILAGGGGTRLWPHSREEFPKQFLPLVSERSLLADTLLRTPEGAEFLAPIITTSAQHRFHVGDEVAAAGVKPRTIVIEPIARNTAAAVAAAAVVASELAGANAIIAFLPADHVVTNGNVLREALARAAKVAGDYIVTIGIKPTRPDTGYGYIEKGKAVSGAKGVARVKRFIEKPDAAKAKRLLAKGGFFWNAGIFVARTGLLIEEMARHAPKVLAAAEEAVAKAKIDPDFVRLDEAAFANAPSISFDYAVMEKTDRAAIVPASIHWSDVGSWYALWQANEKTKAGNVEKGDVLVIDSRRSLIQSEAGLVAAVGLENMLVVQTPDATLVAPIERAQEVKAVVEKLKASKRREATSHLKAFRPWGSYQSLDSGDRHQVKHLVVKPGAAISLQYHHRRAEHWVVVKGEAKVTLNDQVIMLKPNEGVHIPVRATHRLENPGKEDLHVIEVQCGDYLGEDDIVRLEDKYKRI